MPPTHDHALITRIRQGDATAFRELYLQYHHRLLEFATSLLRTPDHAKDVLHDVFARLWLKRDTLDITTRVDVYLYKAIRYSVIDIQRRQRRTWNFEEASANDGHTPGHSARPVHADHHVLEHDLHALAQRVIGTLPPAEQQVVLLRWRYGLSNREIAEVLEKTPGAVAVYLSRAKEAMRQALTDV